MEYLIVVAIILVQVYIATLIYKKTLNLKSVFSFTKQAKIKTGDVPLRVIEEGDINAIKEYLEGNEIFFSYGEKVVEVALVDYPTGNKVEEQVLNDINNYLVKNKGAVADYHLLKDIVDRNIDSLDEEINNFMPAPLYLGLAATMLGIITGLFQMDFSTEADNFNAVIGSILGAVKIAMIASVFGLGITTALSILLYRPAKSEAEKNKNSFLSFLQVNLLPELIKTETSGISALNDRLKGFAQTLNPAIKELSQIMDKSLEAIQLQDRTMQKVEQLDTAKVARANVKVFNELSKMMESFHEFAGYYQELNRSMVHTVELTNNLQALVSRTVEVEKIAIGIDETFSQNKELNQFLAQNFIEVKSREVALQSVIDTANRSLAESIDEMKIAVKRKIDEVHDVTVEMEPHLKNAFEHSIQSVETMTKEQVLQLEQAYTGSRPKFEKLDKLDTIDEGLKVLATQGKESTNTQELMLQALKELSSSLKEKINKRDKDNNNEAFLIELQALNKHLSGNGSLINVKKKEDKDKVVKALLALNITGFLSLAGFLAYAIFKGMIKF